ncbi:hypothetical protein AAULH_02808, partial [Lactobacillus helveticus MTCC 5463]
MNQLTSLTSKCQITLELPNKVADDFQDEVNNLKIIGTDIYGLIIPPKSKFPYQQIFLSKTQILFPT